MANNLPFLAKFDEDGNPFFPATRAEFKSDLKPLFPDIAKVFTNIQVDSLKKKMCSHECIKLKQCTKDCIEKTAKREKELITVGNADKSRLEPIIRNIKNGEDSDTIVLVEGREFACAGIMLNMYSNYIKSLGSRSFVDLSNKPVPANIFNGIYKWMIGSKEEPEPLDVVELLRAVYILEIPKLIEVCLARFDGNEYNELVAFDIMHRTRNYEELSHINLAMASRISSSALIIIGSRQFLELSERQMCSVIRSSLLAINAEAELLFGALQWLNVDWPSRRSSISNVLCHIRFAYIAPFLLCQFNGPKLLNIGPFGHILDEFSASPANMKMVQDGICCSTLVITTQGNAKLEPALGVKMEPIIPRRWIQDTRCKYHRPVTKLCPNMRIFSYEDFVEYNKILQEGDLDYERYITYPEIDDDNSESIMSEHKVNVFSSEHSVSSHNLSETPSVHSSDRTDSSKQDDHDSTFWQGLTRKPSKFMKELEGQVLGKDSPED